jgi:hypothetical protein
MEFFKSDFFSKYEQFPKKFIEKVDSKDKISKWKRWKGEKPNKMKEKIKRKIEGKNPDKNMWKKEETRM